MTNFELWTNVTIIILLIPTIFYCMILTHKLSKMQQNQQRMIELASALRLAAETYATAENKTASDIQTVQDAPFFEPQHTETTNDEPRFEFHEDDQTAAEEMSSDRHFFNVSATGNIDEPSEAELELLQALRSIK